MKQAAALKLEKLKTMLNEITNIKLAKLKKVSNRHKLHFVSFRNFVLSHYIKT